MARYIGILVNGGKDIDVTVLKEIVNQNDEKLNKDEIEKAINQRLGIEEVQKEEKIFKQEYVDAVLEGMRSVTTETGGTAASIFRDFEKEIGGKTGSAEAGTDPDTGKDLTNAWFAGFAPYDDPEVAIVVSVENGGHGYYTAEIAREVLEEYFDITKEVEENREAKPYN